MSAPRMIIRSFHEEKKENGVTKVALGVEILIEKGDTTSTSRASDPDRERSLEKDNEKDGAV